MSTIMASDGLSSHTLYAQLVSKAQSHEHEAELYELAQLAGVTMDPEVFKIILDLLEMKCSPKTISDVIHSMIKHSSHNLDSESYDPGHRDSSHAGSSLKSIGNKGPPSVAASHPHSSPSFSMPSSKGNSKPGNRSRSSLIDQNQSLHNNITLRSKSGSRRSHSPGSFPSSSVGSSKSKPTTHDASSSHSRVEQRSRHK